MAFPARLSACFSALNDRAVPAVYELGIEAEPGTTCDRELLRTNGILRTSAAFFAAAELDRKIDWPTRPGPCGAGGDFVITETDTPLLLASAGAGAGITTVLPIVEHVARTQPERTVIGRTRRPDRCRPCAP